MLAPDVIAIDRHAHDREITQRLGISAAARSLEPPRAPALGYTGDDMCAIR
jgi:hypothetical protein